MTVGANSLWRRLLCRYTFRGLKYTFGKFVTTLAHCPRWNRTTGGTKHSTNLSPDSHLSILSPPAYCPGTFPSSRYGGGQHNVFPLEIPAAREYARNLLPPFVFLSFDASYPWSWAHPRVSSSPRPTLIGKISYEEKGMFGVPVSHGVIAGTNYSRLKSGNDDGSD